MAYNDRVKRYFGFTAKEKQGIALTSLILGLIMFFFMWRTNDIIFIQGIIYIIIMTLVSVFSLVLFVSIPKLIALKSGHEATYTPWITGMFSGFVISFISYGFLPIVFPGLIEIKGVKRLRHGQLLEGENKKDIFRVIVMAPIVSVFLALFFNNLYALTNSPFMYYAMVENALIAFFSMMPLTKTIGTHLFRVNRNKYFLLVCFVLLFLILMMSGVVFTPLITIGIMFGTIILWHVYTNYIEKRVGLQGK